MRGGARPCAKAAAGVRADAACRRLGLRGHERSASSSSLSRVSTGDATPLERAATHSRGSAVAASSSTRPRAALATLRTHFSHRALLERRLFPHQSVFVEYSRHVHRIALFAARDILAYEELTYDYGYVVGSVQDKTLACLCGAANCRGTLV